MTTYRRPLTLTTLVAATLLSAGCVMLPPPSFPQRMPPPPPPGDERMPPQGHRGPPPEFIEACRGQAEGAKVTITGRHDEPLVGTCERAPNDAPLMFRPEQRPRP